MRKKIVQAIFAIYLCFLLIVVVLKFNGSIQHLVFRFQNISESINNGYWNYCFVPFRSITSYFEPIIDGGGYYAIANLLGNVLAFIPLGFLLPLNFKKAHGFFRSMIIFIISILFIETFQLISRLGYFDIDDIILNLFGCVVGYVVYSIYCKFVADLTQRTKDNNIKKA